MAYVALSVEDFQTLVQPLVGLTVSLPWKGYGSAIFLELGELAPLNSKRRHHNAGEANISVQCDWRVESESTVIYGSSMSGNKITSGIDTLKGKTIQSLLVVGQIPELIVQFSNGHSLRSMVMAAGDPEWAIKLQDGRWVHAKAGSLVIGNGPTGGLSKEEKDVFDLAESAASRWGIPKANPTQGSCRNCASFVPIDGEGHLLDYGVC